MSDEELAEALARLIVDRLRVASRFHLETAMRAAETEGVSGTLVVDIPRNSGGLIDVGWASA